MTESGTVSSAEAGSGTSGSDAAASSTVEAGAPIPIGDQTLPRKIYIENQCTETIWTFVDPHNMFPNSAPLEVAPGQTFAVGWPNKFSGRIWGRTQCTGTTSYATIQCIQTSSTLGGKRCGGSCDTLAEFTLTAGFHSDWYDVSLVDGFTLDLGIIQMDAPWQPSSTYVPGAVLGADGICGSPVCAVNLLPNCPPSQASTDANGKVVVCVNGESPKGNPPNDLIPAYFKAGCPTSYSYPTDDPQSVFRCPDAEDPANNGVGAKDYKVVFCQAQGAPGFPP
jgi:hypothetical protein